MEKTFLRMKKSPAARDAYVQAEVVTALAHQIRAIRMQRNWSQAELAKKMGTTQAAVSRLEDPSYGRLSIKTLLDLSRVFDTGLRVQFVSLVTMLHETFTPKAHLREVPSFEEEAPFVDFYSATTDFIASGIAPSHSGSTQSISVTMDAGQFLSQSLTQELPSFRFDTPSAIYINEPSKVTA